MNTNRNGRHSDTSDHLWDMSLVVFILLSSLLKRHCFPTWSFPQPVWIGLCGAVSPMLSVPGPPCDGSSSIYYPLASNFQGWEWPGEEERLCPYYQESKVHWWYLQPECDKMQSGESLTSFHIQEFLYAVPLSLLPVWS